MKKLAKLFLVLTMVITTLPTFVLAEAQPGVVFYNAAGAVITSLDEVSEIYAEVNFDSATSATVIGAHYNFDGKLEKTEFITPVNEVSGYTTPSFSVENTDVVKIFAWSDFVTLTPVLNPGVIYKTPELPTATVTTLNTAEIEDVDLTFAMNFKADEVNQYQLATYGNWYADYVLTVNKTVSYNANGTADAYLAGQYDSWSKNWLAVPTSTYTVEANTPVKVMESAAAIYGKPGLKYTYKEVYESVKDFDCGVFFGDEFIAANPDLTATLELRMYNPENESESYNIGETYTFTAMEAIYGTPLPTATVTMLDTDEIADVDLTFAMNFKADAITEKQLATYGNWYADYVLTVNKTVSYNANGTADAYLAGQYDSWSKNWLAVPTSTYTVEANTPVKVMESAAAIYGKPGLKYTYKEVYESVKDFDCGVFFGDEFLAANPDLTATLELRMYNPENESESYVIGETYTFKTTGAGTEPTSIQKFETKFTGDFLYRVGNKGRNSETKYDVLLSDLFTAKDGVTINNSGVYVSVDKVDEEMNVSGTFTADTSDWTKGTINFEGTGVVKVTIQDYDYCTPTVLYLEVVDATNITSATGTTTGGNFVLLDDVNASSYVNYWNSTLYGNGFTYSLSGAPTDYNSKQGHGIIITDNATLDNLVIVGDIYNSYGAFTNQDNYNAAIDVKGETNIRNCYISGCSTPVSTRANATIENTTLYGGTVGNLIITGGTVTLENVTTANYDDGRELVGMGIVIHEKATEATKLVLNGTLKQYNFINESKVPSDTYAQNLHTAMFDSSCSRYHFGASPNRYVNTGIISLTTKFGFDNITDNANTGYNGQDVSTSGFEGYVYTQPNTNGSVDNNYNKDTDIHISTTQGAISPSCEFDYSTKNYVEKTEDSNDYCYEENGTVFISMDEGDTFNWDTSILTITKSGKTIPYTVSMNGVDYTGKSIAFNKAGSYTVNYAYTDSENYKIDADGNITKYSQNYVKSLSITVLTVKAAWKDAEIKVNKTAMSGIYVMSGDYDYSYKMKFLDCITITDYDEAGNGSTVDLSKNIKSTSFVDKNGANPGKFNANSGTVTIKYNDGKILTVSIGAWSGSGPSTQTCSVKTDNGVYLITDGASNAANIGVTWKITGYSYTGNNGSLVTDNTTITFTWDKNSEGYNSKSECITPETLITLADGSQVEVQNLTGDEELLVWNMEIGSYDTANIVFIDSDDTAEYDVVTLTFSDGTETELIYEHGYFDVTLGKYVYIDKYNAESYIGHNFVKQADIEAGTWDVVTLESVSAEVRKTKAYSPVTFSNLCYYVDGMLSMPGGIDGLFNIFEVDTDIMAYDAEKMAQDIETYGLYTYADFEDLIPEYAYEAFNGDILKVAIGKGMLTWEDIEYLANRYGPLFNK